MENYNGICHYCGQIRIVQAESQEDADKKSSLLCDCDSASCVRNLEDLKLRINTVTTNCEGQGYEPLDEDVNNEVFALSVLVLSERIEKASITLEKGKITISGKSGSVKVNREEKRVLSAEG